MMAIEGNELKIWDCETSITYTGYLLPCGVQGHLGFILRSGNNMYKVAVTEKRLSIEQNSGVAGKTNVRHQPLDLTSSDH